MSLRPSLAITCTALALGLATACTGPSPRTSPAAGSIDRREAVRVASSMIGAPYRYGGSSPRGFDCSGLVVYSYARAGLRNLPHSATALKQRTRRLSVSDMEPGDLLFFRIGGKPSAHVAIYVGDRSFVHAPSSGKRVEQVSMNHTYWEPRLERVGRLE